jgi:undecaprenyl-diphosphatase
MAVFKRQAMRLIVASALTAVVGYPLIKGIEHVATKMGNVKDAAGQVKDAQIEDLFGNLPLIAISLGVVGVFIIVAGLSKKAQGNGEVRMREAGWIGAVQGLCLPFRGFSRSGATISTGLVMGAMKARVEEFSFALAVILTPAAVGKEAWRLIKVARDAKSGGAAGVDYAHLFGPSMLGLVLSFLAGLVALKLLSRVLERGRWHWFGVYCICFAAAVGVMAWKGF